MNIKSYSIFLILMFNSRLTTSRNVDCTYNNLQWGSFGKIYVAVAKTPFEITSPDQTFIDLATGSHLNGYNHENVTAFSTVNIKIHYFPRGLEQIFSDLQGIEVNTCQLKEIHQADLRWYLNLLELHVTTNDIEVIEPGLFDYNPNLRFVNFNKNKIREIGSNVFDHLSKLSYLYLGSNNCINKSASNSRALVQDFIRDVRTQCPNPITPVVNCLDTCSKCQSDVSTLNHEVDILKTSNAELLERIEKLKGKSQCSVIEIANKLRTLMEELERC